jgi:protein TonB
MPELQHRVMPTYPRGAKQERITGKIVLQVLLDREGVPRAPAIVKMDPGTEELACAAVEAVQQWRYKPATRGGEPVSVWFHIVVKFELR